MIDFGDERVEDEGPMGGSPERSNEAGQGLAEYALILALIAAVSVVALGALGGAIASSAGFTMF